MPLKYAEIDLTKLKNKSVLVIDDNHAIHRDYLAVLRPDQRDEEEDELDRLEDFLLGKPGADKPPQRERNFQIQSTYQGEEAHELVTRHLKKGIRYPLAFVDMRMPPGWDGLETIERIREVDPDIHFVIVTAYSDYPEELIEERLGKTTNYQIVYKPFDPPGLYELAYELVANWNQANVRDLEQS